MSNLLNDLPTITASSILTLLLLFLLRNWLSERLKQSIQHEYSRDLESLKASLKAELDLSLEKVRADSAQARAVEQVAATAFLESRRFGHEKTLNAIESLWATMLRIDATVPSAVGLLEIITEKEYEDFFSEERLSELLHEKTWDNFFEELINITQEQDTKRLYCGEYLWWLYFMYRAIKGRLTYLLLDDFSTGSRKYWKKDPGIRELLTAVLESAEINQVYESKVGGAQLAFDLIKNKFLSSASQVISGNASANESLEQARKIAEATRVLESGNQNEAEFWKKINHHK